MTALSQQHIATMKDAANKLTGTKRRAFQAQVTIDYLDSRPRLAERTFGWDRKAVGQGLHELRKGIICIDNFKARGNKKTEDKNRQLEADICRLARKTSSQSMLWSTPILHRRGRQYTHALKDLLPSF